MACGKPVISTRVGAIPSVVENGETGILVDPQHKQLASAILKLALDENLRRKMGNEGRQKVEREYDWNIVANKYIEKYEKVANNHYLTI